MLPSPVVASSQAEPQRNSVSANVTPVSTFEQTAQARARSLHRVEALRRLPRAAEVATGKAEWTLEHMASPYAAYIQFHSPASNQSAETRLEYRVISYPADRMSSWL